MPETSDPKIEPKQTQIVVDNRRPITSSRPRYKKENDFEILWIKQDDLTQACSIRSPAKQIQEEYHQRRKFYIDFLLKLAQVSFAVETKKMSTVAT